MPTPDVRTIERDDVSTVCVLNAPSAAAISPGEPPMPATPSGPSAVGARPAAAAARSAHVCARLRDLTPAS
jgi:hypothetical protein